MAKFLTEKTAKNSEIESLFTIDTTPRVYGVFKTKNPDIVQLGIIANVEGISSSSASKLTIRAMGWDENGGGSSQRTLMTIKRDTLTKAAKSVKKGAGVAATELLRECGVLESNESVSIEVSDSYSPAYDGHSPRQTRDGDALVSKANGKPIYRTASLVIGAPMHDVIEATSKVATSSKKIGSSIEESMDEVPF